MSHIHEKCILWRLFITLPILGEEMLIETIHINAVIILYFCLYRFITFHKQFKALDDVIMRFW